MGVFALILPTAEISAQTTQSRTSLEVIALIKQVGSTAPDWWGSVTLDYPKTLDLSWPVPKQGSPWDPSKNIGQFVWSIINENPSKWKQGIRFLHHVLEVNKDNPAILNKTMDALGNMYYNLHEDWARAAFWWKKSGARNKVGLANCYYELGCKSMAMDVLSLYDRDYSRNCAVIKLYSDMGELAKAMELVKQRVAAGAPLSAYIAAGDACRQAGRYKTALKYYRRALAAKNASGREIDNELNVKRAQASIEAVQLFDDLDLAVIPDGTYKGSSISYAGMLNLEVVVKAGRIDAINIKQHEDKQFFSALTATPRKIIAKQSIKGVDAVTGATITSEAIINATAKALASGMKQ